MQETPFTTDKMFAHADRIAEWQRGRLPPPVTVELDLTNLCNHACPGCTFSYLVNISRDSIPMELAESIVDQLADCGVRAVTFSGGGEPLVYGPERVLSLMERITARGMDTALITNGSLLNDERFMSLCKWVRVSLDGYDADTFARFHGRNDKEFAKVVEGLHLMGQIAIRRRNAGLPCATLGAGFLTDAGTLGRGDFVKMAEFCAGIDGLDYVQFRPLVVNMVADATLQGGGAAIDNDTLQGVLREYQAAKQYARDDFKVLMFAGKYQTLAQPGFGKTYDKCLGHFLEAVVSADARVYICCHTQGQERFCLGDLRQNTFDEVWRSERAKSVYEATDPRYHCPPVCRMHMQNLSLQSIQEAMHPNFI